MNKWKVVKNSGHISEVGTGKQIATVHGALWMTQERLSNARLIAAAPELLQALKELLADVEYAQPKIENGLIGNLQIKAAREAIARAEG